MRISHCLAVALLAGAASSAHALTLVTSPGGLGGNDTLDWSSVTGTNQTFPSPLTASSAGGVSVTVADAIGSGINVSPTPTFVRNFTPNDTQLSTGNFEDLFFDFATPVRGVGTNVTTAHVGPYNVVITAYNQAGGELGTFNVTGINDHLGQGTAPFVGVAEDSAAIARIRIQTYDESDSTSPMDQDSVIVNRLVLLTGGPTPPPPPGGETPPPGGETPPPGSAVIPEPASLGLLGLAGAALALRLRRR